MEIKNTGTVGICGFGKSSTLQAIINMIIKQECENTFKDKEQNNGEFDNKDT